MDTQAVRSTLEQLLREHDSATKTLEGEGSAESSELSHVSQHPGDAGSEVADNDREVALLEAADERRAELQAALARLDAGTYGACVDCGKPVGDARLEFRPEAARCLEDQQRHEAAAG